MAKISTYTVVAPKAKDKIIISESGGTPSNVTKNVTVDGLRTFIVSGIPDPTLQEVTTSGNTTTKNITTQGIKSEGTRNEKLIVKVGDYDGSLNKTKLEVDVAAKTVSVEADTLRLNKLNGNRTDITFNPTASRSIAMPDASGTIALTSDLPSASPWNPDTNGINYQAGNVGIGTVSAGDALTVNGQISSTSIETGGMLVEGNATFDETISAAAVSATSVTATTLTGNLVGTIDTTTTGITQPSTTDNNLLATTAFVQDLLGDVVSGLQFQDTWDASTDTPDLSTATPNNGDFWIVKIAGTTDLSGITAWAVGDWAIYIVPSGGGGSFWQKIDNGTSLTGQGTGNQVAKWSGAGASDVLTNSIITDTGTAVGIGVPNPASKLEVDGAIQSQSISILERAVIGGDLNVAQGADIIGGLDTDSLSVGGNAAVTGNLEVLGDSNFQEVITTALSCTGFDSSSLANLDGGFTSGTSGTINGELTVTDEVFLQDNLNVTGDIFLTSDLQNKISSNQSSKIEIIGDTAVSVASSNGLDFSVSDTFDFKGQTAINVFNGGTLSASLDVSQITTSRNFQFPDNSGTVALVSDIPAISSPSEWVGQISQNSTSAPVIARTQTSTLFVGDRVTTPTAFRDITFSRNAVGTYRLAVNWTQSTVPTDANKLSIMFGDNVARVYTFTLGSINGVNYKEFLFRTYTPAGVEADGQLLGINGAMTSVILYP